MKRYSVLPITLYRFQYEEKPNFRQKRAQRQLGRSSFDFILGENKLYNPAVGNKYLGPNGLSLRPMGVNLAEFVQNNQVKFIYELPKDLIIPQHFVVIHQVSDHYSLQTVKQIQPEKFSGLAMEFFKKQKRLTIQEITSKVHKHFE